MVHKDEEVSDWFQNLCSWKKIDFLCHFLRMCHPLELRFLGTYLENLAKKDFNALRDAELKVNDPNDLKRSLSTDFDSESLGKVIVALSLLHSTSRTAANVIYNILCHVVQTSAFRGSSDFDSYFSSSDHNFSDGKTNDVAETENPSTSDDAVQDLLLSLTLAVNHPAFLFAEYRSLQTYLQTIIDRKRKEDTKPKYIKESRPVVSDGSTSFTFYNSNFSGLEFLDSSSLKMSSASRTLPHSHSAPVFKFKVRDRAPLLKKLQLQKYADNLSKFSDEQLYQLTERELEEAGLPKEAAQRLQKALQSWRLGSHVNGLVFSSGGGRNDLSSGASSPSLGQGHGQGHQSRGSNVKRATADKEGDRYRRHQGHQHGQGLSDDNSSSASSLYSSPQSSPSPPEPNSHVGRRIDAAGLSDDSDYPPPTAASSADAVNKSASSSRRSPPASHIPPLASKNYVIRHHHVAQLGGGTHVYVSPPYLTPAALGGAVHHQQQKQQHTAAEAVSSKSEQNAADASQSAGAEATEGLHVDVVTTADSQPSSSATVLTQSQVSERSSSVKQLSPSLASGGGVPSTTSSALTAGSAVGQGGQRAASHLPPQVAHPGSLTNMPPPPLAHPFVHVGGASRYHAPPPQFRNGGGMPPGQGRLPYAPYSQYPPYYPLGSGYYPPQPVPYYQPPHQLANGMDPMLHHHPAYVGHMVKTPGGQGGLVMGVHPSPRHPASMPMAHYVHQQFVRWQQQMQQPPTCYNCGDSTHSGAECPETTMDALTAGGAYHLSYQSKEDAELS